MIGPVHDNKSLHAVIEQFQERRSYGGKSKQKDVREDSGDNAYGCWARGHGTCGLQLARCLQWHGSTGDASSDGFEWDEETDVLVVGSGLAGVAAAVTVAKEDPNATCLLIEKGKAPSAMETARFPPVSSCTRRKIASQDALEYLKELRENEETGTPDDVLEASRAR